MRPLALAAALTFAAAIALTLTVALTETPMRDETRVVHEVQDWPFPGDALSDSVRALTTTWLIIVLGCVLAAGLAVTGARREALTLLAMIAVLSSLQPALKDLVDRPRPGPEIVDIRASITSESFPAGHVMSPTVLYGYAIVLALTQSWPRVARYAVIAAAAVMLVLTGVVNIWLGVHWPADIVAGYLWGAAIVLSVLAAAQWIDRARPSGP